VKRTTKKSNILFKKATKLIPGGVNSPVRSFSAVDSSPVFIKKAKGSYLFDEDNNKYIDYIGSFGPLILGHSNSSIIKSASKAMEKGTTYGACHKNEIVLAKLISENIKSMEMVRLTSSGTEATMSSIRLARAFTGKDKIIKFEGCYHGHVDHLLVQAGSGLTTFGSPSSPGIPRDFTRNTIICKFNDIKNLEKALKENKKSVAAIILEPVPANMGLIIPKVGYLESLMKLAKKYKTLVIFDEVISGFRLSIGGAQNFYNLRPDLTCIGKVIGGGFPIGAFGGRKDIMSMLSPSGPVYHAGTLSGNPVAVSAGIKTLEILKKRKDKLYQDLDNKGKYIKEQVEKKGFKSITINQLGSMLTIFFNSNKIENYSDVLKCDTKIYGAFFNQLLSSGIMLAPSQFEAMFLSTEHSKKDLDYTISKLIEALDNLGIK